MIDVALMGCGRWGSRLLQTLAHHSDVQVRGVVDPDVGARRRAAAIVPGAAITAQLGDVAATVTAVLIATPSADHATHARAALDYGLDVFVEKPLALTARDADMLCACAAANDRIGMVGHVLRFNTIVCGFVDRIRNGTVGRPEQIHAKRFTQSGSPNALWTLGPHDLSTVRAIDPSDVTHVSRHGGNGHVALTLRLASGLQATLQLSTSAPAQTRHTTVHGSSGTTALDELRCDAAAPDPLTTQLTHFAHCIAHRQQPRTSFKAARWVVDTLERASR